MPTTPSLPTHLLASSAVRTFLLAGRALLTVLNTRTGKRFTFKVHQIRRRNGTVTPHFVHVLTGPENTADYSYLGVIFDEENFAWTRKSPLASDSIQVQAFSWLLRNCDNLPDYVEVWHHNHCARCGKLLTVPESISSGLGPICADLMGVPWERHGRDSE